MDDSCAREVAPAECFACIAVCLLLVVVVTALLRVPASHRPQRRASRAGSRRSRREKRQSNGATQKPLRSNQHERDTSPNPPQRSMHSTGGSHGDDDLSRSKSPTQIRPRSIGGRATIRSGSDETRATGRRERDTWTGVVAELTGHPLRLCLSCADPHSFDSSLSAMAAPASGASGLVGEWKVQCYLYDLSQGMARAMSMGFLGQCDTQQLQAISLRTGGLVHHSHSVSAISLTVRLPDLLLRMQSGKQIDGIWHTGIVVYGREYFFGGGIQAAMPGQTMAGRPGQIIDIGYTRLPPAVFHEFLESVSHRFTTATYSLLEHNCNNFSNEASIFLTGKPIPAFITGLPAEALATPFGQMLLPMIQQMEQQMKNGGGGPLPWGGATLDLPKGLNTLKPDRLVAEASNPSAPHSAVQAAAALAAQALENTAAAASTSPTSAAAAPAAAASSSSAPAPTSILSRSGPAKPLTSADKKSKSFQVLIKANAKKVSAAGLNPQDDATLTELVNALSAEGSPIPIKSEALTLITGMVSSWAPALQFPVLGVLRLMVLRPECVGSEAAVDVLTKRLLSFLPSDDAAASASAEARAPPPAQAMALCTLSNLFVHPSLASSLARSPAVWSTVRACASSDNLTVKLMSATLCYNAVISLPKDDSDVIVEAVTFLSEHLKVEAAADVAARMLLALGECALGNANIAELLVGLEFGEALTQIQAKFAGDKQVQQTCSDLATLLNNAQQAAFKVE